MENGDQREQAWILVLREGMLCERMLREGRAKFESQGLNAQASVSSLKIMGTIYAYTIPAPMTVLEQATTGQACTHNSHAA
eukprot:1141301-Pelagomonas_calceolata.AAC.3